MKVTVGHALATWFTCYTRRRLYQNISLIDDVQKNLAESRTRHKIIRFLRDQEYTVYITIFGSEFVRRNKWRAT